MPAFFARSITVFILIALGGYIGMVVSPQADWALLWPPAGVALAAILLWGRVMAIPVYLGLVLAYALMLQPTVQASWNEVLLIAVWIAFGAVVQSAIAARLCRRIWGRGVPALDRLRSIIGFFFIAGPFSCLISASLAVEILDRIGWIDHVEYVSIWLDWWVADSLGVALVLPLLFCLWAQPKHLWRARRLRLGLPVLASFTALAIMIVQVSAAERTRLQAAFDHQAVAIDHVLAEHINNAVSNALSVRDLFLAHREISREQFAAFSQPLLDRHPEVQVLEWLPRVPRSELKHFEALNHLQVKELNAQGGWMPVAERDDYFPITYAEPLAGNEQIIGLDSTANPFSRSSKQAAALSGQPSTSQSISLIQEPGVNAILLSVPIYPPAADGPVKEVSGFVSAVILPTRLVKIAMKGINIHDYAVMLEDLNSVPEQAVLYADPGARHNAGYRGLHAWQSRIAFCDHVWRLTIHPNKALLDMHGSKLPWMMLIGGSSFTVLLGIFLLSLSGQTSQVEMLINARTAELEQVNRDLKAKELVLRKSENHLRTLVESQPECVQLLNRDAVVQDMNPAGLQMLGAEHLSQVKGSTIVRILLPQYQAPFKQLIGRVFEGQSCRMEFEIDSLKGERRWLESHAVPIRNHLGMVTSVLAICRDISERKQSDAQLQLAARVFGEAHEGILITDAQGIIVDVNPTFCDITGYAREEAIGRSPSFLHSGKQSLEFYAELWRSLKDTRHWQGELWNKRKNGELYAEWLTISALTDEVGQTLYYVGLFSDITQLKRQQQMLELLAHYDPLTQLPNRALFSDRLLQAIARAKRERTMLAICFLDLDGFKPINDQFGHDAGDMVLIEVAQRIKVCIREEDSVSRHGGDEFALLLGNLRSVEECEQALLRIRQSLDQPLQIEGQHLRIGGSIGITLYPLDDADPDTLLRHADHAMYQAKLAGKNCHSFFNANEDRQAIDRHKHLREIEAAFENQELCLHYQPKVNIETGSVYGLEALLRWQHPLLGIVMPKTFLPVIAGQELEVRVGEWVIAQAWRQLCAWHRDGLPLEVSVNISAYHLLHPRFTDYLRSVLTTDPEVESRYLQLEILESTALDDLESVNRVIRECRDTLGLSVALDDFGTGYSSLTHLRHLPIDTVKIDCSFVRDMLDDPDDYAIVESIIGLSQVFRRRIVAEGVETPEHGLILMLMGCRSLQGYAIAKAMSAEAFADWLQVYRVHNLWTDASPQSLSQSQTHIAIHRIDIAHWLRSIENWVRNRDQRSDSWPQMSVKHSLFGRWLEHAQRDHQYNDDWIGRVDDLHRQLRQKAQLVMLHCRNGDFDLANNELLELKNLQRHLDHCLSEHA
jgi:diguanylate cyclase (GGDEF)-like protein/PAS domain S-box-containing protein